MWASYCEPHIVKHSKHSKFARYPTGYYLVRCPEVEFTMIKFLEAQDNRNNLRRESNFHPRYLLVPSHIKPVNTYLPLDESLANTYYPHCQMRGQSECAVGKEMAMVETSR